MRTEEEASGAVEERMLIFELEAAEALAGLARSYATGERRSVQKIVTDAEDQVIDVQLFSGSTSATVSGPLYTERNVDATPIKTCSISCLSKVGRTSRQNLTESEKEARRLSRILANRESARRTIYRRQSMHMNLTEKATLLSQENTYLKKEKELALKTYHLLKDKNELLKAQVIKLTKAKPGELQDLNSSGAEAFPATATTPISLHNQPSLLPILWPPIVPSSDIFNSQCTSNPGTPLLLLPVPWLLPFLTHRSTPECHFGITDRQKETSSMHQCCSCASSATQVHENNHQSPLNTNSRAEASKSMRTISLSNYHGIGFNFPPEGSSQNTGPHLKASVHHLSSVSSAPELRIHNFMEKNRGQPLISPSKISDNVSDAAEARKKRKALMKLKNINCQDAHGTTMNM